MILNPAKQSRITENMVHQIEQAIIHHRLKPCERIQTERELQNTFQVSRGAVREALSILRQKGLIETRRGGKGGTFVKKVGVDHASEGLAFLIKYRQIAFQELAEFREAVEGLAAMLAVERAAPEDIDELKEVLKEMGAYLKEGGANGGGFYKCERKMHEILAKMSGNTVIEWILKTIHMNLDAYAELIFWDENGPREFYNDWSEIVKAIENGQGVMINSLIRSHIIRSNQSLKEGARRLGLKTQDISKYIFR